MKKIIFSISSVLLLSAQIVTATTLFPDGTSTLPSDCVPKTTGTSCVLTDNKKYICYVTSTGSDTVCKLDTVSTYLDNHNPEDTTRQTSTSAQDYFNKRDSMPDAAANNATALNNSSILGNELGSAGNSQYGNITSMTSMLRSHQEGGTGVVDLAGNSSGNDKYTKYDICLMQNPTNRSLCASDEASSIAYKNCISSAYKICSGDPQYQSDIRVCNDIAKNSCSNMASSALATVDFRTKCENSKPFLKLSYVPVNINFDIQTIIIEIDKEMDGSFQWYNPLTNITASDRVTPLDMTGKMVSGICSLGVVACEAGTWHDCKFLAWGLDEISGVPLLYEAIMQSEVGTCYCINKSCGSNLPFLNGHQILQDLSLGLISQISRSSRYADLRVTEKTTDSGLGSLNVVWKAAREADCEDVEREGSNANDLQNRAALTDKGGHSNDYIEDAGADYMAAHANDLDYQGEEMDVQSFSNPQIRSEWTVRYNANGTNFIKMIKNMDTINGSTTEKSCSLNRLFSIQQIQIDRNNPNDPVVTPITTITRVYATPTLNGALVDGNITLNFRGWKGREWHGFFGGHENHHCPNEGPFISNINFNLSGIMVPTTDSNNVSGSLDTNTTILLKRDSPQALIVSKLGIGGAATQWNLLNNESGVMKNIGPLGDGCNNSGCNCKALNVYTTYEFKFREDWGHEGVTNGCTSFETDTNCQVKNEMRDDVTTISNFMSTGLEPMSTCKEYVGSIQTYEICRPWWRISRVYSCTSVVDKDADITEIRKRAGVVSKNLSLSNDGSYDYKDTRKVEGQWTAEESRNDKFGTAQVTGDMDNMDCVYVCETRGLQIMAETHGNLAPAVNNTPNQPAANLSKTGYLPGLNTSSQEDQTQNYIVQNSGPDGYKSSVTSPLSGNIASNVNKGYKPCAMTLTTSVSANVSDWECQYNPDEEEMVRDCFCPNDTSKVVGQLETSIEVGKNMSCTPVSNN